MLNQQVIHYTSGMSMAAAEHHTNASLHCNECKNQRITCRCANFISLVRLYRYLSL